MKAYHFLILFFVILFAVAGGILAAQSFRQYQYDSSRAVFNDIARQLEHQ